MHVDYFSVTSGILGILRRLHGDIKVRKRAVSEYQFLSV